MRIIHILKTFELQIRIDGGFLTVDYIPDGPNTRCYSYAKRVSKRHCIVIICNLL